MLHPVKDLCSQVLGRGVEYTRLWQELGLSLFFDSRIWASLPGLLCLDLGYPGASVFNKVAGYYEGTLNSTLKSN